MKTITSILVPTDFSAVARNAFHYAIQLADALDADIEVLHCIAPISANVAYGSMVMDMTATLQQEAKQNMNEFIRQGLLDTQGQVRYPPRLDQVIAFEELSNSICDRVTRGKHELLIMGTAGKYDNWDKLLGTNASYLIKRAPCPVLIVPRNASYQPIERLCFATDLRDVSSFQAGKLLRALRPFDPSIDFLHVRTDDNEVTEYDLDLLREVFDRPGTNLQVTFTTRQSADLVGAIFAYAFERGCGLVVMHRPTRSWFHRLLRKSNTGEAVLRARLPLLILNSDDLTAIDSPPRAKETAEA